MTVDKAVKGWPPMMVMQAHEELVGTGAGRDARGRRRGRSGRRCERCSPRAGSSGPLLDAEFFAREPVRRALAGYDFGYVFRAVRRAAGLTQEELGDLLDLEQDRISRIERGQRRLRDIEIIARVASRLGIPPVLLGFVPNVAGRPPRRSWIRVSP